MKMDSASLQFIAFGVAVAFISNIHRSAAWRCIVLFVASIGFLYMLAHNVIVLIPLASFLLLGYLAIVLIDRGWLRLLSGAVIAVILVYVWLKKYTFLPQGIFLHYPYFTLGLSYIFFRVLHLIIETGEGNERRHISLGAYLLYMLNFTTFISGPIQRYDEFARDQFAADPISLGPRVIGLTTGTHCARLRQGQCGRDAVQHGACQCTRADVSAPAGVGQVLGSM